MNICWVTFHWPFLTIETSFLLLGRSLTFVAQSKSTVLFTQDSKVEHLFCGASSGPEPGLFFSNYFFSLKFKPIQDDFQQDFARKTDKADSTVVLAKLQDALFREYNNQRLSPWGRPFTCSPDPVTDLC